MFRCVEGIFESFLIILGSIGFENEAAKAKFPVRYVYAP